MEGRKEAAYRRSWRLWRSSDAHRNLSRQDLLRESRSWRYSRRKILRPDEFSGLDQVLPCYTGGGRSKSDRCPNTKAKIEAIFIEGHADADPFHPATVVEQRRSPPGHDSNGTFTMVSISSGASSHQCA